MKTDLDNLMKLQDIDALLIFGGAQHNPAMVYFVGTAHVSDAILIKKRAAEAVLFHYPMERDEAAKSGYHWSACQSTPGLSILSKVAATRSKLMP